MEYGCDSMTGPLKRVLVCPPAAARWGRLDAGTDWRALGYLRPTDAERASLEHDRLCALLRSAGCEVRPLPASDQFSLDAVYAHDASLVTCRGAICLRMGKAARCSEPAAHRAYYESCGIPLAGSIVEPGTVEAGDVLWLNAGILLVGRGYRTNAAGIEQLRHLVSPGVRVVSAPLPHGGGTGCCLHLMSLISLLDDRTALVDLPWLAVETVEMFREAGYRFIEIDPAERATLACNVLALGNGRLIALSENPHTNERLRSAGFEVMEFAGGEIGINGGGGPTCLTRPLLRC
jgi:N-dimethylarginine dimethylaminohydrolase